MAISRYILTAIIAHKIDVSDKMCNALNFFVVLRYTRRLPGGELPQGGKRDHPGVRRFAPRNDMVDGSWLH